MGTAETVKVTVPPAFVYLIALVIRLVSTCLIFILSPYKCSGVSRLTSTMIFISFSAAREYAICKISFNRELKEYSALTNSILPDSILDISRISLIRESRNFPEESTLDAYSSIGSSQLSLSIISFMPKTALIGVRISCDILARKSLLARFAFSASFLYCIFSCSNSSRLCSTHVVFTLIIIAMTISTAYKIGKRISNVRV